MSLTFLDFFAGVGGFRKGMEMAGHKCLGHCEIDKFANMSYEAIHQPKEDEWFEADIRRANADELPRADVWCFGFPCQDISVAGKQLGFKGQRSSLFFTVTRLIRDTKEEDRPKYLFIENVKNLLSVNGGTDFLKLLIELDEVGYDAEWQVLNSKNFGVPQNRERVFIIANLRSRGRREILPLTGENEAALNQLVGGMQGYRVYGTDGLSATLVGNAGGVGAKTGLYFIDQSNTAPKVTDTARCLTARYTSGMVNHTAMNSAVLEVHPVLTPERMEKRQNGRRMKEDGEPMFTLTSQDRHGVYLCEKTRQVLHVKNATKKGFEEAREGDSINLAFPDSNTRRGRVGKGCSQTLDCGGQMGAVVKAGRIRRLTPRECFRLQGFPDALFDRAAKVNSDAQLYKQAGNAVTATVAYAVAMSLPESREEI